MSLLYLIVADEWRRGKRKRAECRYLADGRGLRRMGVGRVEVSMRAGRRVLEGGWMGRLRFGKKDLTSALVVYQRHPKWRAYSMSRSASYPSNYQGSHDFRGPRKGIPLYTSHKSLYHSILTVGPALWASRSSSRTVAKFGKAEMRRCSKLRRPWSSRYTHRVEQ